MSPEIYGCRQNMPKPNLRDYTAITGIILATTGIAMVSVPAALIAVGVAAMALAIRMR